jgi:hypothetical protein
MDNNNEVDEDEDLSNNSASTLTPHIPNHLKKAANQILSNAISHLMSSSATTSVSTSVAHLNLLTNPNSNINKTVNPLSRKRTLCNALHEQQHNKHQNQLAISPQEQQNSYNNNNNNNNNNSIINNNSNSNNADIVIINEDLDESMTGETAEPFSTRSDSSGHMYHLGLIGGMSGGLLAYKQHQMMINQQLYNSDGKYQQNRSNQSDDNLLSDNSKNSLSNNQFNSPFTFVP